MILSSSIVKQEQIYVSIHNAYCALLYTLLFCFLLKLELGAHLSRISTFEHCGIYSKAVDHSTSRSREREDRQVLQGMNTSKYSNMLKFSFSWQGSLGGLIKKLAGGV